MTKAGFHTITVSEATYQRLEQYRQMSGLRSISASVKVLVADAVKALVGDLA